MFIEYLRDQWKTAFSALFTWAAKTADALFIVLFMCPVNVELEVRTFKHTWHLLRPACSIIYNVDIQADHCWLHSVDLRVEYMMSCLGDLR